MNKMTIPAHVEVYTAWQLARRIFPRRKILAAYYHAGRTDDGLMLEFPDASHRMERKVEFYTDEHLRLELGAWQVRSAETVIEDAQGHKQTEWTRAFLFA